MTKVLCGSSFLAGLVLRNAVGICCCCHLKICCYFCLGFFGGGENDKCFVDLKFNRQGASWADNWAVL